MRLTLLMFALLLGTACVPDDVDGTGWTPLSTDSGDDTVDTNDTVDTSDTSDTDTSAASPLVGDWRSEGADLSTFFASNGFKTIDVTFKNSGGYTVRAVDTDNEVYDFTGTYSTSGGDPQGITLVQTVPFEATSKGLFAISGDTLSYEVVQTQPDFGNTPPSGSFGTSSGTGFGPGENVQTYRRN